MLLFFCIHFIHLPGWAMAIAIVDAILMSYGEWNSLRMGFFVFHIIGMQAFITRGRICELNSSISAFIFQSKVSKSALPLRRALARYRQEHCHLLRIAVTINDLVSSRLMIAAFLTNIFINVMLIAKLIFELPLRSAEAAVVILIIFAQTVFALLASLVQIAWSKALVSESSIHLLYISQPMLRVMFKDQRQQQQQTSSNFRGLFSTVMLIEKLKLSFYFELVCTRKPFKFTLGHLGGISKKSFFEVWLKKRLTTLELK